MKLTKLSAALASVGLAMSLAACSDDADDAAESSENTTAEATTESNAAAEQPSQEELNEVLSRASDPNLPAEEKVNTVQGGETAPQLFETMAASKAESGAEFDVVEPILPGYTPDSVLATVNFTLPDRAPQVAENVEFIHEDGHWKLSQSWACTLITNTVPPEDVPEMCTDGSVDTGEEEGQVSEQ